MKRASRSSVFLRLSRVQRRARVRVRVEGGIDDGPFRGAAVTLLATACTC